MKRHLLFINKESGFFFPYVLFITTLVMITTMAGIQNYQKELQITSQQIKQLRVETLFQMGRKVFKDELMEHTLIENQSQVTYNFPDGIVTIKFSKIGNGLYHTEFQIYADPKTSYTFTHTLIVPYDEEEFKEPEFLEELLEPEEYEGIEEP